MKIISLLIPCLFLLSCSFAQKNKPEIKDFNAIYQKYKVDGSFLLYNLNEDSYTNYHPERCEEGFLPASTFKIINSLIGLETGLIKDENFVFQWDGKERWNANWNKDNDLKTAFQVSCVPCYQELARKVGLKKMKYWVKKAHYGKLDIRADNLDMFWLEGNSRISQKNQISFLVQVYKDKTPFSKRSIDILKNIMILEKNENYTLRAKTGWTKQDGKEIGWFVGWLEKDGQVYFFANNIESPEPDNDLFNKGRREITEAILKDLGIL